MTSKTRPLTEQEAIDEQYLKNQDADPVLEGDVKKLRKRLFRQSDRIKNLQSDWATVRERLRKKTAECREVQAAYESLLESSRLVIAELYKDGYFDRRAEKKEEEKP